MAFIQNLDVGYSEPFNVKGLSFAFDNSLSTSDKTVSASYFGLDDSIVLIVNNRYTSM